MARPKKDNALKEAAGSYRADRDHRMNAGEPMPEIPKPPVALELRAAQIWQTSAAYLAKDKIAQPTDLYLLASYCQQMAYYLDCFETVSAEPTVVYSNGNEGAHPLTNPMNAALKNALSIASKMGFTPLDRAKMAPYFPKENDSVDPTDDLG
jgi:P27 family predicted phage terminase small subunit